MNPPRVTRRCKFGNEYQPKPWGTKGTTVCGCEDCHRWLRLRMNNLRSSKQATVSEMAEMAARRVSHRGLKYGGEEAREIARKNGQTCYVPEFPCKNGGLLRYVIKNECACPACQIERYKRFKEWKERDDEKKLTARRAANSGEFHGQLVSRKVARERGLPTYFNGEPCLNGNVVPRTASGHCTCKECRADRIKRNKEYYSSNVKQAEETLADRVRRSPVQSMFLTILGVVE